MSKKKNKFKNRKSHQSSAPLEIHANVQTNKPTPENTLVTVEEQEQQEVETQDTDKYSYVKRDIKKLGLIMTLIIIALVGIYILSIKTSTLSSFGDWLYKIANIQTG